MGRPEGALGINQDNSLRKLRFRFRAKRPRVPGVRTGDLGSPVFLRAFLVAGLKLAPFVVLDALPGGPVGAFSVFLAARRHPCLRETR